MRFFATLIAAIAFSASASLAHAETLHIKPIAVSAEAQEKFDETYGAREIATLSTDIMNRLGRELREEGVAFSETAGGLTLTITLEDAVPNRPTFKQLIDRPGLDALRSFGVGGATLSATIAGPDGAVLQTVRTRYYERDIEWAEGQSTWGDAQRAIRRFADQTAQAVATHAGRTAPNS